MAYLRLLRPHQWVKNVFVFAGLVFGHRLTDVPSVLLTLAGFASLCLVSSAVYVINDVHDREEDRVHPRKRERPIAAGVISVPTGLVIAATLLFFGLGFGWLLRPQFGMVALTYLLIQVGYTFGLKHAVILDVITIGLGFVLRAVSGAVLIGVPISHWLVLCTFTLCLFMGFSKRRCELNALAGERAGNAGRHRRTLDVYTPDLLNHMTTLTAGIAIVSFMLYTVDDRTVTEFGSFGSRCLLSTLPIVVYAVFRFAVLVEHGRVDGPTDVLLRDRPFQAAITLWVAAALGIVYGSDSLRALLLRLTGGS